MPHDRFYIDAPLHSGDEVSLQGAELHHLAVMRMRAGQSVELINDKGSLAKATLLRINRQEAALRIDAVSACKKAHTPIILAQGIPHKNHLEWIVEKGTELGVEEFWLFPARLGDKSTLSENQLARLRNLILAAVKQCGRGYIPSITIKPPLEEWLPLEGTLFYGDPSLEAPFLWHMPKMQAHPAILFIGPEAGWDGKETFHLQNRLGAQPVRLHENTLRTETASLAALSLIQLIL
ncbi:MAG TPA: RsmE family RNA methyltransferase [Rhabdochlamydiaceae bacterium]|jgi:16S rRNA (uracil1498-N3)-methyltransferase